MMEYNDDSLDFGNSLSIGSKYHYIVGELFGEETFVEGNVVFNDGVTAILKVTKRYGECWFQILHYDEVIRFIPAFYDAEADRHTEYLCIDVETEENPFFRDPDTDTIMTHHYDEEGNHTLIPADDSFHMERLKKLFIHDFKEWDEKEKAKEEAAKKKHEALIRIYLLGDAIDDMYSEYDKQKGNPPSDNSLHYGLNRSVKWLNNRNCAILTAWRGYYSKSENNHRNKELLNSLRNLGYGVIRVRGCYAEVGRSVEKENSFLVFDLEDAPDFKDRVYELSEHYEQDCFLYKPLDENVAYLIGTNDSFGKGKIEPAGVLRINSDKAKNFSEIASGRVSFEKDNHTEEEEQLDTDWENE